MNFVYSSHFLVVSCYLLTKQAAACLKLNAINDDKMLIYLKKIKGFVGILYAVCVR